MKVTVKELIYDDNHELVTTLKEYETNKLCLQYTHYMKKTDENINKIKQLIINNGCEVDYDNYPFNFEEVINNTKEFNYDRKRLSNWIGWDAIGDLTWHESRVIRRKVFNMILKELKIIKSNSELNDIVKREEECILFNFIDSYRPFINNKDINSELHYLIAESCGSVVEVEEQDDIYENILKYEEVYKSTDLSNPPKSSLNKKDFNDLLKEWR